MHMINKFSIFRSIQINKKHHESEIKWACVRDSHQILIILCVCPSFWSCSAWKGGLTLQSSQRRSQRWTCQTSVQSAEVSQNDLWAAETASSIPRSRTDARMFECTLVNLACSSTKDCKHVNLGTKSEPGLSATYDFKNNLTDIWTLSASSLFITVVNTRDKILFHLVFSVNPINTEQLIIQIQKSFINSNK